MFTNLFNRGGMLTGSEIERQIRKGNISIDPFDPKRINPNSYNLRLHPQLLIYSRNVDRSCELPTGIEDPYEDFIARERNRLGVYTVEPITKEKEEEIIRQIEIDFMDKNKNDTIAIPNNYSLFTSALDSYIDRNAFKSHLMADTSMYPIDMNTCNDTISFDIPETGYVLRPGVLYIGRTVERTSTEKFIPMLDGRSSGGRLGISIHICAGFGDIGFDGTWTLEITVVEPVIVYPYTEIAQVSYFKPYGKTDRKYRGRYYGQVDATASRFYRKEE